MTYQEIQLSCCCCSGLSVSFTFQMAASAVTQMTSLFNCIGERKGEECVPLQVPPSPASGCREWWELKMKPKHLKASWVWILHVFFDRYFYCNKRSNVRVFFFHQSLLRLPSLPSVCQSLSEWDRCAGDRAELHQLQPILLSTLPPSSAYTTLRMHDCSSSLVFLCWSNLPLLLSGPCSPLRPLGTSPALNPSGPASLLKQFSLLSCTFEWHVATKSCVINL